jgi:hypothetical protein
MGALYVARYTDTCGFRAISRDALKSRALREMTYGWNIEMHMCAARRACASWKPRCHTAVVEAAARKSPVLFAGRSEREAALPRPSVASRLRRTFRSVPTKSHARRLKAAVSRDLGWVWRFQIITRSDAFASDRAVIF